MKTTFLKIVACLFFYSCSRLSEETQTTTTSSPENPNQTAITTTGEWCFRQVAGRQKQDTAWVYLKMKENKVTGEFLQLPFEKDSRRGTLSGTKTGNDIMGTWTFSQEGQTDSLPVHFQLIQDTLRQKPYSYATRTGRAYLSDSASFTIVFERVDCRNFPVLASTTNQ